MAKPTTSRRRTDLSFWSASEPSSSDCAFLKPIPTLIATKSFPWCTSSAWNPFLSPSNRRREQYSPYRAKARKDDVLASSRVRPSHDQDRSKAWLIMHLVRSAHRLGRKRSASHGGVECSGRVS